VLFNARTCLAVDVLFRRIASDAVNRWDVYATPSMAQPSDHAAFSLLFFSYAGLG
jgi:hypothetical protein